MNPFDPKDFQHFAEGLSNLQLAVLTLVLLALFVTIPALMVWGARQVF